MFTLKVRFYYPNKLQSVTRAVATIVYNYRGQFHPFIMHVQLCLNAVNPPSLNRCCLWLKEDLRFTITTLVGGRGEWVLVQRMMG